MQVFWITLTGILVLGAMALCIAFMRQFLLNREKTLHEKTQQNALNQEVQELTKIRREMYTNNSVVLHDHVLGVNTDSIQYLDKKIKNYFRKKMELINFHVDFLTKKSAALLDDQSLTLNKKSYENLKQRIESTLEAYDKEIKALQSRRSSLWVDRKELLDSLLHEEQEHSRRLDELYQQHSRLIEKMYLRYGQSSERALRETRQAGTQTFKLMVNPLAVLIGFFKPTTEMKKKSALIQAELDNPSLHV